MKLPLSSNNPVVITADTSTIINLRATGRARDIVRALGSRFVVVGPVLTELEAGKAVGYQDSSSLGEWIADGLVRPVDLNDSALARFAELVIGPAVKTLDDGEAATIAYALETGARVAIDERKATAICLQRFPELTVHSTVDLLAEPAVAEALGRAELSAAVFRALRHARMQVSSRNLSWVVDLIGKEKAALCSSLSRSTRRDAIMKDD